MIAIFLFGVTFGFWLGIGIYFYIERPWERRDVVDREGTP